VSLYGIGLKRDQAISVLIELLDGCMGLDGHGLELIAPNAPSAGYQIVIKGVLDEETKKHVETIAMKHQLSYQTGNLWKTKRSPNKLEPDTLIIYKPKNNLK
jgi:hypothetical protein